MVEMREIVKELRTDIQSDFRRELKDLRADTCKELTAIRQET